MESNKSTDIFFADPDIFESQWAYTAQFKDIPFWTELGESHGPRLLELACGNGRITLPLAERGLDIDGLDFSEPLIKRAREFAKARSLKMNFFVGDIRALPFKQQYDLMYLPAGTISHLVTRPDVESFLEGVRRGLRPGGVLALDVHNPTKTFLKALPLRTTAESSSFILPSTKETVQLETRIAYSSDTQIFTVSYHYTFANGRTHDAALYVRLYFPVEMQALLHYNGFEILSIYGDYTQRPFDAESQKYVVVARGR